MQTEQITVPVDVPCSSLSEKQSYKGGIQSDPLCHQVQPLEKVSLPQVAPEMPAPTNSSFKDSQVPMPALERDSNKELTLGRAKDFIPLTQARPLPFCLLLAVSSQVWHPCRAETMSPRMSGLLHPLQ